MPIRFHSECLPRCGLSLIGLSRIIGRLGADDLSRKAMAFVEGIHQTIFSRAHELDSAIREPNHVIDLVGRQLEWFDRYRGIRRPTPAEGTAAQ